MAKHSFFIFALAMLAVTAAAVPVTPAPPACSYVMGDVMDCLAFVSQGGYVTEPSAPCCAEVSSVANNSPACLCTVAQDAAGLGFNLTRVLQLPQKCNLSVPDMENCKAPAVPPSSPEPAPGASPVPAPIAEPPATSPMDPLLPEPPVSSPALAPETAASNSMPLSSSLMVLLISLGFAAFFSSSN